MRNYTSSRPAYEAFSVKNLTDDRSFWTKIGAAWNHEDGKGLSLVLTCFPIDGKVVLREPKED